MKAKLKIGPQTATDYKRTLLPNFENNKSLNNMIVKDSEYFGQLSKNLWGDYGKLISKNKTFLSKERNAEIEKNAKDLEIQDKKDKQLIYQSKVLVHKQESKQRIDKKLLEIALLQQQSSQDVDERQIHVLLNNPQSPFQINKSKIKSPGREYLNGTAENKWNNLREMSSKSQKIIFTPKVIQFESEGVEIIKKKLESIEENKEMIKHCYDQQRESTRRHLNEVHQQNIDFEKDLKLGQFGKTGLDKSKNKIVRIAQTPATYTSQFPTKYKMDPYIQKLKDKPLPEKDRELCKRLATPKKDYVPKNVFEYQEFQGMLIPSIDKVMCVKQDYIVQNFKENPSIKVITQSANNPNLLNSVIKRPNTACSQQRGFIKEPLSSFDNIQAQRSQNFIQHNDTEKEIAKELDKFSEELKKTASSKRPLSGFCKVTQKENDLLKSVEGLRKVREFKKESVYPYNVIKGLDNSL